MSSYMDLRGQAAELMRQAEELRKQEIAAAVVEIRQKMSDFGITIEDLGGRKSVATPSKRGVSNRPILYRGPNGETWSGGPGRKPGWINSILAAGGGLDGYRVRES